MSLLMSERLTEVVFMINMGGVAFLPLLFAFEMGSADSMQRCGLLPWKQHQKLIAYSVFKIPVIGFSAFFLPLIGLILLLATTAFSVIMIHGWHDRWEAHQQKTKQ